MPGLWNLSLKADLSHETTCCYFVVGGNGVAYVFYSVRLRMRLTFEMSAGYPGDAEPRAIRDSREAAIETLPQPIP